MHKNNRPGGPNRTKRYSKQKAKLNMYNGIHAYHCTCLVLLFVYCTFYVGMYVYTYVRMYVYATGTYSAQSQYGTLMLLL